MIDAARMAAGRIGTAREFNVTLDRALTFQPSNAFVLRVNRETDSSFTQLRAKLKRELKRVGIKPETETRTPHMTLLYDTQVIPESSIEPITWSANSLALILSHSGLTYYELLGSWPFKSN